MLFILVPFYLMSANLRDPGAAGSALAPLQWLGSKAAGAVSGVIEEYVYLVDVNEENEHLALESARLREETRRLRAASAENRRLRDLLQLRTRIGGESIAGEVIAKEISPFFRVLRLEVDRGNRDRIQVGMPVVSTQGLVGQIRGTSTRHAEVVMTVDRDSAVDVIVQRTGARGMLRGTGESHRYLCRIQNLSRDEEVAVGDEIYTSGMGQRFPASILVGRVSEITRDETGLFQEVEVVPAVDFGSLEEVLILTSSARTSELSDSGEE